MNDCSIETKAVPDQMFPNLKMIKQIKSLTQDDGNTTADSNSQSYISPPQQKGVMTSENPETSAKIEERNNTPSSSNFDDMCSVDDSALKMKSHVLVATSTISENDQENHESKSDDGMTLNQMIDAKCDGKIDRASANSSRRGSFSMTTASQQYDESQMNRDETQ